MNDSMQFKGTLSPIRAISCFYEWMLTKMEQNELTESDFSWLTSCASWFRHFSSSVICCWSAAILLSLRSSAAFFCTCNEALASRDIRRSYSPSEANRNTQYSQQFWNFFGNDHDPHCMYRVTAEVTECGNNGVFISRLSLMLASAFTGTICIISIGLQKTTKKGV